METIYNIEEVSPVLKDGEHWTWVMICLSNAIFPLSPLLFLSCFKHKFNYFTFMSCCGFILQSLLVVLGWFCASCRRSCKFCYISELFLPLVWFWECGVGVSLGAEMGLTGLQQFFQLKDSFVMRSYSTWLKKNNSLSHSILGSVFLS